MEASLPSISYVPSEFKARAPWFGGDLQTLRNFLSRPMIDLSSWPERRLELAMHDGSGDRLVAKLHEPASPSRGLVVLVHGLTGCEDSFYIRASARHWLDGGYAVLRLNLRGAGPSRPLCVQQYHAGRSGDLRDALLSLQGHDPKVLEPGIFLVGYSLGANLLLRFLAEEAAAFPLVGAASVSAPIDLRAAQRRIMAGRNWVYHRYLLVRMREEALAAPVPLSEEQRLAVMKADSVYAFDDRVVAPANGFAGAEDYYTRCSAQRFLPQVDCPTLVLHADNDPWIPVDSYRRFDWSQNGALSIVMPRAGGHVGFHGRGSDVPWHDKEIGRFFAAITDP